MNHRIPHDGGGCPVNPSTRVEVFRRKPGLFDGGEARFFTWPHTGGDFDIVEYRVVHPAPVPADRDFRRAVFLAVVSQALDAARSPAEEEMAIHWAWAKADEAIAQEGA